MLSQRKKVMLTMTNPKSALGLTPPPTFAVAANHTTAVDRSGAAVAVGHAITVAVDRADTTVTVDCAATQCCCCCRSRRRLTLLFILIVPFLSFAKTPLLMLIAPPLSSAPDAIVA